MQFEGNEAAAMAAETGEYEVNETNEVDVNDGGGFIVTEAYTVPPATPKWHSGTIVGVTRLDTKSGTTGITVTYHSDSNGREYEGKIWPPAAWVENPRISRAELEALPTQEGKKQSPLQRFGSAISNSKGTGDVDKLLSVAKRAGRTTPPPTYKTFDEFLEGLNTTLSGCPTIFTTKEEKNDDPQYQARESVNGVYGYDFDPTKLKAYVAASGA